MLTGNILTILLITSQIHSHCTAEVTYKSAYYSYYITVTLLTVLPMIPKMSFTCSMCQTPSKRRTDGRRDASLPSSVRPFVSLSLVSVRDIHPMGEGKRTAMLHRNLRGDKNLGSTNNTQNLVS